MPVNDELGKRMKEYYGHVPETGKHCWVSTAWDRLMNDTDRAYIQGIVNIVEEG